MFPAAAAKATPHCAFLLNIPGQEGLSLASGEEDRHGWEKCSEEDDVSEGCLFERGVCWQAEEQPAGTTVGGVKD